MTFTVLAWASITALVSAGVSFGVVLYERRRRLAEHSPELIEAIQERLTLLDGRSERLGTIAARLESAEQQLAEAQHGRSTQAEHLDD